MDAFPNILNVPKMLQKKCYQVKPQQILIALIMAFGNSVNFWGNARYMLSEIFMGPIFLFSIIIEFLRFCLLRLREH